MYRTTSSLLDILSQLKGRKVESGKDFECGKDLSSLSFQSFLASDKSGMKLPLMCERY